MTGENESAYSLNRKVISALLFSARPIWIMLTEMPPDLFHELGTALRRWMINA